uniref:C-type lectin domain-containing protein n=1 Tax=Plectus sambesii TaxID=2011161 RepID=A0A914W259_9BILA
MECNVAEFKQRIDHRPYMDVRDQGSCGSCWAFASTNAIQGAYSVMSNKKSMNYSTQQLLDCSGALCSGATFQSAVDYFKTSSIGLIPESSKAYVGEEKNPSCSSEGTPSDLFLHDFTLFHAKEPKTLIEIHDLENRLICSLQKGPVAVGIAATNEMTFYKEGVFDSVFDWVGSINHAVVVVGYEKDHFIVMNSYGSSWGENGYIRLPRGKNAFHMTEYQFAPKVVHKYPHYHQGIVYRLYKEAKNWQSAENRCKEDGGHLASIHNQEQEEFIHSLTIGANANVWIGLKANSWSDGSEMNFGLVSSACSSINNADGEKITESECNDQLQFICAIKA